MTIPQAIACLKHLAEHCEARAELVSTGAIEDAQLMKARLRGQSHAYAKAAQLIEEALKAEQETTTV